MKNIFSNGRLSYFLTPRIHGNVLAWIKPASESERNKCLIENILRWEDDGGKIIEINSSKLDRQFFQPVLINGGKYDRSLQWNEQFVIELFQAGTGIDSIRRIAPNNHPSK
ncbi:MAG TPA: hypothetical protein VJ821_07335 [Anaerolineales bacterium]|nr:hypothetical protein [Anaerolineales bacterium]